MRSSPARHATATGLASPLATSVSVMLAAARSGASVVVGAGSVVAVSVTVVVVTSLVPGDVAGESPPVVVIAGAPGDDDERGEGDCNSAHQMRLRSPAA